MILLKTATNSGNNGYFPLKRSKVDNFDLKQLDYSLSISITRWFGRTRNAVGTRAAGECFHSFFEFSQPFTSVSI